MYSVAVLLCVSEKTRNTHRTDRGHLLSSLFLSVRFYSKKGSRGVQSRYVADFVRLPRPVIKKKRRPELFHHRFNIFRSGGWCSYRGWRSTFKGLLQETKALVKNWTTSSLHSSVFIAVNASASRREMKKERKRQPKKEKKKKKKSNQST